MVVSNSDVHFTYKNLLNDDNSKESIKYKNLEPSSSAIVFYWGVKGYYPKLDTHNILFSKNYEKEFDELFNKKTCPNDPTVYIYISSKFIKDDAPEGHENWFVMINAPYINKQNWDDEINKTRNNVLNKIKEILNIDISNKIVFEKTLSPIDIEKNTNSFKGSIYGISSNTRNAAFLRQQNKSKNYEGLYFCGGSAHPGGGIPLVISSGQITADLIFKKYN